MTFAEIVGCVRTAFDWHSGGGSPLYRFASNRKVDDEQHRHQLAEDIVGCMRQTGNVADQRRLEMLHRLVTTVATGHEVCTYADAGEKW